ncbi:MAG: (2Fe-2S)-binding protein [Actinomycetota bacterium]
MYVCHCRGVTDRQIMAAIQAGARDRTGVARRCSGAGARCGGCQSEIARLLESFSPTGAPAVAFDFGFDLSVPAA